MGIFGDKLQESLAGGAAQAGAGIIGMGIGALTAKYNDKRQLKMQQQLQDMQVKGQKEMGDYNYQRQMEMWNATNYSAQVAQMEKAGINPALLYGMGGGGGTTVGTQGGAVGSGTAPSGGGEIMGMMQIGLQQQMMQAQIEATKAQARKTNTEADNLGKGGIDYKGKEAALNLTNEQTKTEKGKQGLLEVQNIAQGLANQLASRTQNDQVRLVEKAVEEIDEKIGKLKAEGEIGRIQARNLQKQIDAEIIYKTAQTNLANSGVKLNEAQEREIANSIAQKWYQLRQGDESLRQGQQQITINKGHLELRGKRLDFDKEIHNVTDKTKMTVESAVKLVQSIINVVDIL